MSDKIIIKGARTHNLKNINVEIPKNKLVVITGLSGSGKSSLAFDTIYAEAQRRYMESLSSYARQFLELQERPDIDEISGLTPAIALDQRGISENPRSTVATATEIADYLRLLFARVGHPFCPICKKELKKLSSEEIVEEVFVLLKKQPLKILSPIQQKNIKLEKDFVAGLLRAGFEEVSLNGEIMPVATLQNFNFSAEGQKLEVVAGKFSPLDLASDKEYVRINILNAIDLGDGRIDLDIIPAGKRVFFSTELTCPQCGKTLSPLEPRNFSFNSPHGACEACGGLGVKQVIDPELVAPNPRLTLAEGAIKPWTRITSNQSWHYRVLQAVARVYKFSLDDSWGEVSKTNKQIILNGSGDEEYLVDGQKIKFAGVIPELQKRYQETTSDYLRQEIESYMRFETCPVCQGRRLKKEALAVTVDGKNIADYFALSIEEAIKVFSVLLSSHSSLSATEQKIAKLVVKEIVTRLGHLNEAGLSYLTLDRNSVSLSGGESERIRLAIQLATILSGVLYILDEPTVGLHERDTEKLTALLQKIRDVGNSVIVVEHDAQMMRLADWIVDMGPGAGLQGGEVIAAGTYRDILKDPASLTGAYLSGKKDVFFQTQKSKKKTAAKKFIEIKGATANNLKNVDVKIPLGQFVCVTGVSGSGKSTLILDILARVLSKKLYRAKDLPAAHKNISGLEAIDKAIIIDQSPIGRTPRSNAATYTGIFTIIRDLFAAMPEAKLKGHDAGTFSFNVRGGRCEACAGEGYVRIPMQFLPETFVECNECHGTRYRTEALEIHYHGKNIADILGMSVSEAAEFFTDTPLLVEKLKVLEEVGLGYLKLGQPATTLSGGEAQRVKLAAELGRRATGKTLYILDEPTTGLHFEDTLHLLTVLRQLVEKGNSVVVIEHNMAVIGSSDWIIDLGPEGGDKGGEVVAQGRPRDIVKIKSSWTGQYLKRIL
ncbi:MAG: excinuclease ABC subunit UvrA [bacterium]|nr:excinuclease ABC subunit UvrA [bacterium]